MGCHESTSITEVIENYNQLLLKSVNINSVSFSDFYCKYYRTIKKVNSKIQIKDIKKYHQCILQTFFKADLCSKLFPSIEIIKLNKYKYISSITKIVENYESNQEALFLFKSFMELETTSQIKFIGIFIILIGKGSIDSKIRILSQHIMFLYSGGKYSIHNFISEFQRFNISLSLQFYKNCLSPHDLYEVERLTNDEKIESICYGLIKSYELSEIYYINKLLTRNCDNNTSLSLSSDCSSYNTSMLYSHQRNILVEFLIANYKYFEFGYITNYLLSLKNN